MRLYAKRSEPPLEILFQALGKGTYRYYDRVAGDDWELKVDSDFSTYFDGKKYHVAVTYARDRFRGNSSARIVFDGNAVMTAWFSPGFHPTGAQGLISLPQTYGDGLSRPDTGDFPWDITKLASNVWDPERLLADGGPHQFEIKETPEGDIIGTYLLKTTARVHVRFECPRRFGYNIAIEQVFNAGEERPAQESRLEWKQSANGLWYVRSIDERFILREGNNKRYVRQVLKYSVFELNAKIEPSMFTDHSLRMPDGTSIVDRRHDRKVLRYRKE